MNDEQNDEPKPPLRDTPRADIPLIADDAARDFVAFIQRQVLTEAVNLTGEDEVSWLNQSDKYPVTQWEYRDGYGEFFDLAMDWLVSGAGTYFCPTYESYLLAVIQCLGRLSNDGRLRKDTAGDPGNPTSWWIRVFEDEPPREEPNVGMFRLQRNSRPAALDREQFHAVKHQIDLEDRFTDSRVINDIASKLDGGVHYGSIIDRWLLRAATHL